MATKSSFIFRYRVGIWPAYNRALVGRGSLTFRAGEQAVGGTWHRLIRERGWGRVWTRFRPAKPANGVRKTGPDGLWHIDASKKTPLPGRIHTHGPVHGA